MAVAELLSQGHEVVTGQTADTNAAWLSAELVDLGFRVSRHTAVGDDLADLVAALREIAPRCDLCLCTGGLGPTADDLTAQAVAEAFDRPLRFDPEAMAAIEAMYARFDRPMPEVNRKQAWLPAGAIRLDNAWGTAPGFAVRHERAWFAFLPGVPREMRAMFEHRVLPFLRERFAVQPGVRVTLRTVGVGESNLQERVGEVRGAVVSYRTALPENHVKLLFDPDTPPARRAEVVSEVAHRIGAPLFAIEGAPEVAGRVPPGIDLDGGDLAQVVGRALASRQETLAVAESCTGGRVASMCTAVPGSSAWFLEGAVTYSNAAKVRQLGVDPATLAEHGAVSEPVARQMASGIRAASGATYGVSTTGIAGPSGGTATKPVGLVHLALSAPSGTTHRQVRLPGPRHRIQILAAATGLDLLRRHLQSR